MNRWMSRMGWVAGAALLCAGSAFAQVKIAYVDPLSGGAATIGEHGLKHIQFLIETINAKGGVMGGQKLEVVAYDNKGSPQESLVQVQKAIDALAADRERFLGAPPVPAGIVLAVDGNQRAIIKDLVREAGAGRVRQVDLRPPTPDQAAPSDQEMYRRWQKAAGAPE